MRVKQWNQLVLLGVLCLFMLLLFASCGKTQPPPVMRIAPVKASTPTWVSAAKKQGFSSHGQYIAAQAITLAQNLYGAQNNQYYADDPTLASTIAYWKQTCQNADGSLCTEARSGSLQCVEFATGIFAAIDDELPYIGNANQFWNLYHAKAGWQEIPAQSARTDAPALGDIATWTGEGDGHLAIVVDLQAPQNGQDGYITVAQANAPDLFDNLTWHANGQIDSWSGYTLQGFIRQQQIAPCLQQQVTSTQQQWEVLAIQAAVYYGIPSKYFLKQLCQSGFQAVNSQGKAVISATGAIGIAQLPAQVAAQIPRCVTNFVNNAIDCAQMPGSLPAGTGIDPTKPAQAIPAAAYEMSTLYAHYLHNSGSKVAPDDIEAYEMALAAYNTGTKSVDRAVQTCKVTGWLTCLNRQQPRQQAKNYVNAILGVSL